MTRFQKELNGSLGPFWQKEAEKELTRVKADLENGKITIDENGIARNCIGRVLMADMLEKVLMVTDRADAAATAAAREAEVDQELAAYRAAKRTHSEEELNEMRAAFGPGTTVVDAITGEKITL